MPFLTPNTESNPAVSVSLAIPPAFLNALSGSIYELSLAENWEQYGDLTPDECAAIMGKAWRNLNVRDAVLYNKLIAAWELEEESGIRHDWHGGHHLTDNNTVTSRAGKVGLAASFSAINIEYLSLPDNPDFDFSTKSFSLTAWVYLDTKVINQRIFRKAITNQLEFFAGYNLASDRFIFQVSENGTTLPHLVTANNPGSPVVSNWYMVTVYRDTARDELGIRIGDIVPDTLAFTGNIFSGAAPFQLSDMAQPLNGAMDQAFVFDGVLSNADIAWLYNSGMGRKYTEVATYTG